MESLSLDVMEIVGKYLSVSDLVSLAQTSKHMHRMVVREMKIEHVVVDDVLFTTENLRTWLRPSVHTIDMQGCYEIDDEALKIIADTCGPRLKCLR